jgi:hypothetical protein
MNKTMLPSVSYTPGSAPLQLATSQSAISYVGTYYVTTYIHAVNTFDYTFLHIGSSSTAEGSDL